MTNLATQCFEYINMYNFSYKMEEKVKKKRERERERCAQAHFLKLGEPVLYF